MGLTLLVYVAQFPVALLTDAKAGKCRSSRTGSRCLAFVLNLAASLASVNVFRGTWYLLDVYLIPSRYDLSLINGALYGLSALLVFHAGSSLHAGVVSDSESCRGSQNLFEFYYTTYFYLLKVSFKQPNIPFMMRSISRLSENRRSTTEKRRPRTTGTVPFNQSTRLEAAQEQIYCWVKNTTLLMMMTHVMIATPITDDQSARQLDPCCP